MVSDHDGDFKYNTYFFFIRARRPRIETRTRVAL